MTASRAATRKSGHRRTPRRRTQTSPRSVKQHKTVRFRGLDGDEIRLKGYLGDPNTTLLELMQAVNLLKLKYHDPTMERTPERFAPYILEIDRLTTEMYEMLRERRAERARSSAS